MNDQVGVIFAKVVEKHGNLVIYQMLKITLLISSADEQTRNAVVITHFGFPRILVFLEQFSKNVAESRIVKLLLLNARQQIQRNFVF